MYYTDPGQGYYWYYYPTNAGLPTGALNPEGFPDTSGLPAGSMNPQGFPDTSGLPAGSMNPQGFPDSGLSMGVSTLPASSMNRSPLFNNASMVNSGQQPGFFSSLDQSNFGRALTNSALAFTPYPVRNAQGGITIMPRGAALGAAPGAAGASIFSNPVMIAGALVLLALLLKGHSTTHRTYHRA